MRAVETNRAKILKRLAAEGWTLDRHGAGHDLYVPTERLGVITLPRHRTLKQETALDFESGVPALTPRKTGE